MSECVTVVVRCRPLNSKEKKDKRENIIQINSDDCLVSITNPISKKKNNGSVTNAIRNFTFDAVFNDQSKQRQVYDEVAYPLVESVLEGFNGTIFAYGQTGCGKTHTMLGPDLGQGTPEDWGIIPNCFENIFDEVRIGSEGDENKEYLVQASYLEIYNEKIRDLLSIDVKQEQSLQLREHPDKGVYVHALTETVVESVEAIQHVMNKGAKNRTIGATAMNQGSSRSHSIFTIRIESTSKREDGTESFRVGKLNLVDLAGSERQKKTNASGQRLKEGSNINLSLSALGNVISALVDGKSGKHIPYRDSKLTRLLQTSLGGNTKTVMIAAIGPADYNYDETLSTLRYANRAKNIQNKPTINEDPKDAMLRLMKEEIEALKLKLANGGGEGNANGNGNNEAAQLHTAGLLQQQEEITRQLKDAEERANMERQQREELARQLLEMQSKVIGNRYNPNSPRYDKKNVLGKTLERGEFETMMEGGITLDQHMKSSSSTLDLKTVMERAERRKKKHKEAMKRKQKLKEERARRSKQVKKARQEAKSAAEALALVEEICAEKINAAEMEVRDLAREFNEERSSLLRTITDLKQEKKLYEQLAEVFLVKKELAKVWEKAKWRDDLERWQLPKIQGRSEFKQLKALPSLTTNNSRGNNKRNNHGQHDNYNDIENRPNIVIGYNNNDAKDGGKKKKKKKKKRQNENFDDNYNHNGTFVDVNDVNTSNDWWNESFHHHDLSGHENNYENDEFEDQSNDNNDIYDNEKTSSKESKRHHNSSGNEKSSRQRRRRKKRERNRKNIQDAYKASPIPSKQKVKEKRGLKPRTPNRDKNIKNVMLRPLNNIVDPKNRLMDENNTLYDNNKLPSPSNNNNNNNSEFSRVLEPLNGEGNNHKKKKHHRPRPPKSKKNNMQHQNPRSNGGGHLTVKLGAIQNNNKNNSNGNNGGRSSGESSNLIAFPAGENTGKNTNMISLNAVFTFHQPDNSTTGNIHHHENDPS